MIQFANDILPKQPTELMGTLAIMAFTAGGNLRNVAKALGKRDLRELKKVSERNAKQVRLRAEIEELIMTEKTRSVIDLRKNRKLALASRYAMMFEKMGAQTCEIAELCGRIIQDSTPSRTTEVKKMIEHAVYIPDRGVTGFLQDDRVMTGIALAQGDEAAELYTQIHTELESLAVSDHAATTRVTWLTLVTDKAKGIIDEATELNEEVIQYLECADI